MASRNAPSQEGFDPRGCRNLGEVYGKGGGSFGGGWISNESLAEYAITDARNQAAERGANFLQYDSPQFGESGSGGDTTTSSATVTGTAYLCAEQGPPAPAVAAAQPAPAAQPAAPAVQPAESASAAPVAPATP